MADANSDDPNDSNPTEIEISVVARITFYLPSKSKNKRPTKDTKAKNFTHKFSATKDNYLLLLTTILEKHHIQKYKATSRCPYPCKIQVPPTKQADAPDVINYTEYESLVKTAILEPNLSTSKSVTIFVEMPKVEKHAKKAKSANNDQASSSDDEGAADGPGVGSGDDDDADNPGLSKEDYELAKMRTKLEKKYQNDHDAGYTYIDPTGVSMPLTPFMLKEWARGLVDKDKNVDLDNPPHTQTFDPANRTSSLVVANRGRSGSSVSARTEGSSEATALSAASAFINSLTSLVSLQSASGHIAAMSTACSGNQLVLSTPTKSSNEDKGASGIENLRPSPSQLPRFLAYAEEHAGVKSARRHEHSLASEGYGPDILHLVDVKSLRDLGIPAGDVIRLQQSAPLWWKSEPERILKRRRDEPVNKPVQDGVPAKKKMRFEQRFKEGGSCTCFGPGTTAGDLDPSVDFTWYFYSEELQTTIPLPQGLIPVLENEEEEELWPIPNF